MKGLLSSYRWRRRFVWLGTTLIIVAALTVVVVKVPNKTRKVLGPSNVPVSVDRSPKPVRLTPHDEALALRTASQFVSTAVARKNLDRSWELAAPELRAGLTRKRWDQGELPVAPYAVGKTRWNLDYSDTEGVGYSVTLLPAPGLHQPAQDFQIGLHLLGSGRARRWVVYYWQAVPTGAAVGAAANPGPASAASGKPKLGRAWWILPVGLLSLIPLIPIAVIGGNWYRGYRARALLRR